MKISLNYKNRKIGIDVKRCNLFWMIKGLMFARRESAKALLFNFKKETRISIHSFFCPKFLAVWLNKNNNILEMKKVFPWSFSIFPKRKFSKLVEIPCNRKYDEILKFLDED